MTFVSSLLVFAAAPAWAEDSAALVERVRPAVVTLLTEDLLGRPLASGTGFFVTEDGLLVTNDHVAARGPTVAVLHDGTRRAVEGLLANDVDADLALLRVEGDGYTALPLGAPTPPAVRDPVVVIGSPKGREQTVTEGTISALRPDGLPGDAEVARGPLIQLNADIAPGSSGSPVLTPAGYVIGVAQSADMFADTYFAVDVTALKALWARAPTDGALVPMESPGRQLAQTFALVGLVVTAVVAPGLYRWGRERLERWRRRRERRRSPSALPPR